MLGTWWRAFKSSSNFRRTFILAFYTAMILLRTVLNREIWFDPLGKLLEDGDYMKMDRDRNAAINIREEARRMLTA